MQPVVEGVALTRELVTEPANIIYPESFVERVPASLKGLGLEIQVLGRDEMAKLGMGALLGVAQGSVREPQDAGPEAGTAARRARPRSRSSARA